MGLLAVQMLLFLSQQFRWFAFNEKKGWTVLIALAVLGLAFAVLLGWWVASLVFRWRFQFSLRSFLLLVLAIAVPLAWVAAEVRRSQQQREVMAALQAAGATVRLDYAWPMTRKDLAEPELPSGSDGLGGVYAGVWRLKDASELAPPAPEWLMSLLGECFFAEAVMISYAMRDEPDLDYAHLKRLSHLQSLHFRATPVSDAELENIRELTGLVTLNLRETQITDAGLKHLKRLTKIRELTLDDTRVTDAGLRHLQSLTALRYLSLAGTQITDAGLEDLRGLTELEFLRLARTQITGTGLANLRVLPNLRHLHLPNTPISDEGSANLNELMSVEWLCLGETQITDGALVHLKGMRKLEVVNVDGTQVTKEAYRELMNALRNR
jgi:hypothetical protein